MRKEELDGLIKLFFELGQLKRTPRSGWLRLGITDPESVADHSFRTAAIGFLLGKMEGLDPSKVATFCLFHDMGESRTGDLDWLAQRYNQKKDYLSSNVVEDQIDSLPSALKSEIRDLMRGTEGSELTTVARDADLLDLLIQSVEYMVSGKDLAERWFENTLNHFQTKSGKKIAKKLERDLEKGRLDDLIFWWD